MSESSEAGQHPVQVLGAEPGASQGEVLQGDQASQAGREGRQLRHCVRIFSKPDQLWQFQTFEAGEEPQAGCEGRDVAAAKGAPFKLERGEPRQAGEWLQVQAIPCEGLSGRRDSVKPPVSHQRKRTSILPIIPGTSKRHIFMASRSMPGCLLFQKLESIPH